MVDKPSISLPEDLHEEIREHMTEAETFSGWIQSAARLKIEQQPREENY